MRPQESFSPPALTLPDVPALTVTAKHAHILTTDGELRTLSHAEIQTVLQNKAALVCHGPFTKARIDFHEFATFDVLELFAFVHPARFCVPTPKGLARALNLRTPETFEDFPLALMDIAKALLMDLRTDPWKAKADPLKIAGVMGLRGQGWIWTPYIYAALGAEHNPRTVHEKGALNIWKDLPEWAEEAPEPPPGHEGVSAEETESRLTQLLGDFSEKRNKQLAYAKTIAETFQPLDTSPLPATHEERKTSETSWEEEEKAHPPAILAEAGTGIGKTLGYLAPASVWAEKNKGAVWLSTYTKNLQRQINQELDKLYSDPETKTLKVATRKGRENYLCLLNLEDFCAGAPVARSPDHAIAAGIMARWAAATQDGDLTGTDFPGWLISLLSPKNTLTLADRRGECIYSACDHYHRCFVERSVRKSRRARLVVANHALVMINAAIATPLSSLSDPLPTRYVFDEGHHLFNAADSAFAAHLTGRETQDLRRWILGAEGGRRSRARGLQKRAEDLVAEDAKASELLESIIAAAHALAGPGWSRRLKEADPHGPCEKFLALIYKQVFARANGRDGPYSLETECLPLIDGLETRARTLKTALKKLEKPMRELSDYLYKKLAEDKGELNEDTRKRMDAVASTLQRRAVMTVAAWVEMLESLITPEKQATAFIDWFEITRIEGRAIDVGFYRHYKDPMKPFAASMTHVHGMAVTSATLTDDSENREQDWSIAEKQSGAAYLTPYIKRAEFSSPFDYAAQSRIFIVNDMNKNDVRQVAGAYRTLFEASGGGGLGLFTAIQRLRAVHDIIAPQMEEEGLPLYAQHVDEIDPGSLVDMFREEEHACLLGTDAVRDGVDVPGGSLRLLIFDRVPWPRPAILHKARREHFSSQNALPVRAYDEMLTRMKLKQAFGRLIRRADDKGVFVMLDSGFPSRLHSAFPENVEIVKCGLQEIKNEIKTFLQVDDM